MGIILAPSILSADFSDLKNAVGEIENAGADWIHLDVMDGVFVPNITFGPKMVRDLRARSKLPFDVHLMIEKPERYIAAFAAAGADAITFHLEAATHSHSIIAQIKELNVKAGISIVPSTPVSALDCLLQYVDLVLVMTVNPGFGGQSMIESCLEKTAALAALRKAHNYSYLIAVDGGINSKTAAQAKAAGTDVLITGEAFFRAADKTDFVKQIKMIA